LNVFDAHCDTIYECFKQNKELYNNDLSLSLKKGRKIKRWIQTFAIWMPDNLRGNEAQKHYENCYKKYLFEVEKNSEIMNTFNSDKEEALSDDKKITAILSVEGGSVIAGNPDYLEKLSEDSVKLMTLTWNCENELGCGCLSGTDTGLTESGKKAVAKMNGLKMLVDVSHLNEKGFYDVEKISRVPFVATHSNAWDICRHPRNLKKEQIKVLVDCQGLVGLNFYTKFVSEDETVDFEALYRHIEYFLSNKAEKILALGSDFDGADMPDCLGSVDKLEYFYSWLINGRLDKKTVDDIFFNNAYNFFMKNF